MTEEANNSLRLYNRFSAPPEEALKKIGGGRLRGKLDISPQWRLKVLTEMFGPIGEGWWYEITERRVLPLGDRGEVVLLVEVTLRYVLGAHVDGAHTEPAWSQPVVGTGGNLLVEMGKGERHVNDEAEKMAVTDALSVCCKQLGIASDVYMGKFDTKYAEKPQRDRKRAPAGKTRTEQASHADEWGEPPTQPPEIDHEKSASLREGFEKAIAGATNLADLKAVHLEMARDWRKLTTEDGEVLRQLYLHEQRLIEEPQTETPT